MVFCNTLDGLDTQKFNGVTILILVDGFLQLIFIMVKTIPEHVTILILVDGFLQSYGRETGVFEYESQSLF